jgi:hypothetical protein
MGVLLGLLAFSASMLLLPDKVCHRLPGGDELQGECLGLSARLSEQGRCRALTALRTEILSSNNDVVIAGGLEGVVASGACPEIALLFSQLPSGTPSHVPPLVSDAWTRCHRHEPYSLSGARRTPFQVAPENLIAEVRNARCQ